jgi:hypothetical protein
VLDSLHKIILLERVYHYLHSIQVVIPIAVDSPKTENGIHLLKDAAIAVNGGRNPSVKKKFQ